MLKLKCKPKSSIYEEIDYCNNITIQSELEQIKFGNVEVVTLKQAKKDKAIDIVTSVCSDVSQYDSMVSKILPHMVVNECVEVEGSNIKIILDVDKVDDFINNIIILLLVKIGKCPDLTDGKYFINDIKNTIAHFNC